MTDLQSEKIFRRVEGNNKRKLSTHNPTYGQAYTRGATWRPVVGLESNSTVASIKMVQKNAEIIVKSF